MSTHSKQHINIFIAYAREDEKILEQLRKQLSVLENKKLVKVWYDGKIQAGENWDSKIKQKLEDADIVVLLISSDFMSSEYARGIEMEKALEKHEEGTAQVFPVIVRDCLWEESEIATIQVLPKDGKPVDSRYWGGWDAPLKQVVKSVSKAAQETKASRVANEEWIDKGTRSVNKKVLYVAFVKKANELYAREQWQKAVEKYGQALHYYQEDSEPPKSFLQSRIQRSNIEMGFAEKVRLGKAALKAEEWSDALRVINEALHLKPENSELKILQKQAEKQIVLQEQSEKYVAFVEKANEFYLKEQWEKAIETYGQALHYYDEGNNTPKSFLQNRIEQSNIEISFAEKMRLGKAALKAEEWSDALDAFNEALSLKPNDSVPKALQRQVENQIAIAEQSQKYVSFVEKANEFYGEGQWQKAAETYGQALYYYQEDSHPSKSFVQNRIQASTNSGNREVLYVAFVKKANEFYKKEQWKKAAEEYELALYYHQGDNEPPKNFLQNRMQQCKIEMGFAEKMRLGEAALKAKDWSGALRVFNEALQLKPEDSELKALKEEIQSHAARQQQSKKATNFNAVIAKGESLFQQKKWVAANSKYQQAYNLWEKGLIPNRANIQRKNEYIETEIALAEQLGLAARCEAQGDDKMALKHYEAALQLKQTPQIRQQKAACENRLKKGCSSRMVMISILLFLLLVWGISKIPPSATDTSNIEKPLSNSTSNLHPETQKLLNDMFSIEGGTFQMGSNDGEDNEKPVHSVTVSSFQIGKYEVTQAQWEAVMGSNPSHFKGCDQCPVENVSWNDSQGFIKKLNQQTGKRFRLPTEAEWEFAARGGNSSKGFKFAGSNTIDEVAWYSSNSDNKTQPVGTKKKNELGLYDMSGNVWEWCEDDWHRGYKGAPTNGKAWIDSPRTGLRVLRGGSGLNDVVRHVANRHVLTPTVRNDFIGFRLAQ